MNEMYGVVEKVNQVVGVETTGSQICEVVEKERNVNLVLSKAEQIPTHQRIYNI